MRVKWKHWELLWQLISNKLVQIKVTKCLFVSKTIGCYELTYFSIFWSISSAILKVLLNGGRIRLLHTLFLIAHFLFVFNSSFLKFENNMFKVDYFSILSHICSFCLNHYSSMPTTFFSQWCHTCTNLLKVYR